MVSSTTLRKILLAGCFCTVMLSVFTATASAAAATVSCQAALSTGSDSPDITYIPPTAPFPFTPESCSYSVRLAADPAMKAAFTDSISAIRNGARADDDALLFTAFVEADGMVTRSGKESPKTVDRLSLRCLSCHDGVLARNVSLRIKNRPGDTVMSLDTVRGGHPVGMEYARFAAEAGNDFRNDRELLLTNGRVGCLTCHNPANSDKGHLVLNNSNNELCFSCHTSKPCLNSEHIHGFGKQ